LGQEKCRQKKTGDEQQLNLKPSSKWSGAAVGERRGFFHSAGMKEADRPQS